MSMPPSGPGLGHSSTVWALAFNPSGSKMVSCSDDTSLKIWYDTKGRVSLLLATKQAMLFKMPALAAQMQV